MTFVSTGFEEPLYVFHLQGRSSSRLLSLTVSGSDFNVGLPQCLQPHFFTLAILPLCLPFV